MDNDAENSLWMPTCTIGTRAPFGNKDIDRARCVTFRFTPPSQLTSARVHFDIDTLGSLQDTDAVALAVAATPGIPDCGLKGDMPACVVLHGGFTGKHVALNLDLLDISCDPSLQGTPEQKRAMQQAVIDQLAGACLHFLIEDDTAVDGGQLTINEGPAARPFACGGQEGTPGFPEELGCAQYTTGPT